MENIKNTEILTLPVQAWEAPCLEVLAVEPRTENGPGGQDDSSGSSLMAGRS